LCRRFLSLEELIIPAAGLEQYEPVFSVRSGATIDKLASGNVVVDQFTAVVANDRVKIPESPD